MPTAAQIEAVEAIRLHGSQDKAAKDLGISRNAIRQRLDGFSRNTPPVIPPVKVYVSPPQQEELEKPRVRYRTGKIKVMVIGDAHDDPKLSKDRFRHMGAAAAAAKVDYVISIGDFLTLDSLNGHIPNETAGGRLKGTFEEDIASGREALRQFEIGLAGYVCKLHIVFGNHENRIWRFESSCPEIGQLMRGELTDSFEQKGWTWSPYGEMFFLNGVGFVHAALNRLGKTYGGKNAETTICNDAVFDIVIGHSHTARVWKAAKIGPSKSVTVVNVGCSLPYGHVEEYAKLNTTGWTWGITMMTIENNHIDNVQFIDMRDLEELYSPILTK